jgi:hypothetical protein
MECRPFAAFGSSAPRRRARAAPVETGSRLLRRARRAACVDARIHGLVARSGLVRARGAASARLRLRGGSLAPRRAERLAGAAARGCAGRREPARARRADRRPRRLGSARGRLRGSGLAGPPLRASRVRECRRPPRHDGRAPRPRSRRLLGKARAACPGGGAPPATPLDAVFHVWPRRLARPRSRPPRCARDVTAPARADSGDAPPRPAGGRGCRSRRGDWRAAGACARPRSGPDC